MESQLLRLFQQRVASFTWTPGVTPLSSFYAPIIGTILYIIMINVLPKVMEKRQPMKFTYLLALHNLTLSIGSLIMFSAIVYHIIPFYKRGGIEGLVCDSKKELTTGPHVFWYYLFYLSKYYEFLDTLFQILKKRKLIFLHTYHHVITLWLIFMTLTTNFSVQWGDIIANTFVHTVMYYYYYLTERGERVWWKKYITKLQIVQFVFDMSTHIGWYYYHKTTPGGCNGYMWMFHFGNFVIGSFLFLFVQFYFNSYKPRDDKEKVK